ncbi:hypothetical protein [Microbulbifer sp. S227A]|uniref:hypothetical protein n=1 Tax=Microbulbifer sp. S227A TaxID=3415131 RepID=UPI003C7D8A2F
MKDTQITSLQDKIDAHGDLWGMLYNSPEQKFQFPVRPEFSNWIDEQRAWRNSVIFQNMSHHMTDVYFQGPDTVRLLTDLGINSFDGFGAMQAKQYVVCNHDGHIIGDAVLFCEEENKVSIVGKLMAANWVRYHAETGDYDVTVEHIDPASPNLSDRRVFRYQVQGPNADKLLEELNGGPLPDIPFFKMGRFNIGPHEVTALNHRMSGAPGYEFWGPSAVGEEVRDLILKAGKKYDLTPIGGRTYPVTAAVSGWVGAILPAVYTGERMQAYREWLPASGVEAKQSIGGSLGSGKVEDLYRTPYDLGYGFMIKFDHEFIGRAALEALRPEQKQKKVRLIWNAEDVVDIYASGFKPGDKFKKIEMPVGNYATSLNDRVELNGETVGVSFYPVYSEADRACISLASIRSDLAVQGRQLELVWGEPEGGSGKLSVERHVQKTVRVTVDPEPIKRD